MSKYLYRAYGRTTVLLLREDSRQPGSLANLRLRLKLPHCRLSDRSAEFWRGARCYHQLMDRSSGYEAVSLEFLARRGNSSTRSTAIGVKEVRKWARILPRDSSVIDLGCGPGFPITVVLVEEGLNVFGVDAAPSFVAAFQRNLPSTPILCEAVQESRFFDRTFDGVLAIGLMFLLKAEDQHRLIQRFAEILVPAAAYYLPQRLNPPFGTMQ